MTRMRYYLDTEFNSHGGAMISLALVAEDDRSLYLRVPDKEIAAMNIHPWVAEHVIPYLDSCPVTPVRMPVSYWGGQISEFLYERGEVPQIIADWPSDIADFCNMLITGPGEAVHMDHQTHFTILRHIDVYPTTLKDAVQHNAWWDCMALRQWLRETEAKR